MGGINIKSDKELSIIIVNYNKYNLTKRCVTSILQTIKDINYEVIILDNCSPNNSYTELINEYKYCNNVKVIRNNCNKGFGDGNNKAVKESKYRNILLLNPDIIVLENSIDEMLNKLLKDKNIGIIGCKLLNEDMSLQYSCRRFISFTRFIMARTPFKKIFKKSIIDKIETEYLMKDYNHENEIEVDWIMGSCLMLRKKDFFKVDGFSKEYFMYFEDVDLCYKINKINKKVLYFPKASMIHLHEQASTKKINKLTIMHIQSMLKFYKKVLIGGLK